MRPPMPIAVLYPRYDHVAIEERYASWQTQLLLKRGEDQTPLRFYDPRVNASDAMDEVETEHVLIVIDPLILPSSRIGVRLRKALASSGAEAVIPVSNSAEHPKQFREAPVLCI